MSVFEDREFPHWAGTSRFVISVNRNEIVYCHLAMTSSWDVGGFTGVALRWVM